MQEWLNNKKNLPIIIGLSSVIFIAAIVFILFQTGVLGGNAQEAAAPPASSPPPGPPVPGAPLAATGPPGAIPGARPATAAASAAAAPAPAKVAAVPVVGAPGARPDPFEPYIDYNVWLRTQAAKAPPPPRVDSFVPFVRVTNYVPSAPEIPGAGTRPLPTLPQIPNGGASIQTASIGRVSGVMLTNGAFAIVDSQGQSNILQPGDQLPNGAGRVVSIQADGITVRTTGDQMVKVPISAGDATNAPGGAPGQFGPQGPPPGFQGGPPIQQDDNSNGG